MEVDKGSFTAKGVAVLRIAHQLVDGDRLILRDPVTIKLMAPGIKEYILQNKERFFQPEMLSLRSHVVLRSRYAEDCLQKAFQHGVRQFIILGAGMDTFAYRQPAWAHEIHIIEADHPASQAEKILSLKNAGITIPKNLSFVQVDLESDDLSVVFNKTVVHRDEPVFISCLGVLVYLKEKTVEKIFEFAGSFPKTSEFVFTTTQKKDQQKLISPEIKAALAEEPWISHFEPEVLKKLLKKYGFQDISYLSAEDANRLYFSNEGTVLKAPDFSSIVRAVI